MAFSRQANCLRTPWVCQVHNSDSFAHLKLSTPLFSSNSALFAKNMGVWEGVLWVCLTKGFFRRYPGVRPSRQRPQAFGTPSESFSPLACPPWRASFHARTDQIPSARPTRNATKHRANTDWLSDAPKYCQNAACAPGYAEENISVSMKISPPVLAGRTSSPSTSASPID